jgi:hypothetical protein
MKKWHCRDLNMTMDWGVDRVCEIPCIVSTSLLWIRGPVGDGRVVDRLLSGREMLNLQGIGPAMQDTAEAAGNQADNKQKIDLAGNAFCGGVVVALMLAVIGHVPLASAIELSKEPLQVEASQEQKPSDGEAVQDADLDGEAVQDADLDGEAVQDADLDGEALEDAESESAVPASPARVADGTFDDDDEL